MNIDYNEKIQKKIIWGSVVGRVTFSTFFETLLWVVWNWMGMIKDSICQKFEVLNH